MKLRRLVLLSTLAPALVLALPAQAVTLDEAIAAALAHAPAVAAADADHDAATARLTQAQAGNRPTASVRASVGYGYLDTMNFFGMPGATVTPIAALASIEQPLFTGGRVSAANDRARAGIAATEAGRTAARAQLAADVAAAYGAVLTSDIVISLYAHLVAQTAEITRQAQQKFRAGESPSTEVSQAQARHAEALGALAQARGSRAAAGAHYRNLVGVEPVGLMALPPGPAAPATLDAAIDIAAKNSPAVMQAQAALAAAQAAARGAKADRLPTVGAFAEASAIRDEFFPDYRANAATVGVRANWQFYNGGRTEGRVAETNADVRAAAERLRSARAQIEEAVIAAWSGVQATALMATAAADQARAADASLASVRHEVRVGLKPQLDLLDAEREAIAAASNAAQARANRTVIAYRLGALLGSY